MFQGRPRSKRDRSARGKTGEAEDAEAGRGASERRAHSPDRPPGIDPDIAGIVPGPQANPWGDDLSDLQEDEEAEEDAPER